MNNIFADTLLKENEKTFKKGISSRKVRDKPVKEPEAVLKKINHVKRASLYRSISNRIRHLSKVSYSLKGSRGKIFKQIIFKNLDFS
jgi:hypothetical protein